MDTAEDLGREIKPWSLAIVAMMLVAEFAYFTLLGESYFFALFSWKGRFDEFLVQLLFPLAGGAFFMVVAGWNPCSMREQRVAVMAGLLLTFYLFFVSSGDYAFYSALYFLFIPLGLLLFVKSIRAWGRARKATDPLPPWVPAFGWITLATVAIGAATNAMLRVGALIYPLTYDLYLLKIDAAFGGFAHSAAQFANFAPQWVRQATSWVYALLPVLFFPLLALLIRERKIRTMHGWRAMVLPYVIAWACYAWIPATGPIAVFGAANFPQNIPPLTDIQSALASVTPSMRNAMPSMHVSGAIWILMMAAALQRKSLFVLSALFLAGTAWATLALGEHYVIDLVVALPFATSVGLWLMSPPRWRLAPVWAKALQLAGGSTFVLWMGLIRLAPHWLEGHPGFVRALALWSALTGLILLVLHIRSVWREADTNEDWIRNTAPELLPAPWKAPNFLPAELKGNRWLVGIFFFSGFAGLVYEVVYAKALGVTFGGTALAANTVLMTYMGGMAIGAWLGGVLAERSSQPLMLYAMFEAVIGLYAAVTPFLFSGIQSLYVALATDSPPDAAWLTALRMALGAAVLGLPTVLMGATLPLVFQCLRTLGIPTGRAIAPLYGANVLGAAVGALVAGYALLPAVGRNGGTLLAAVISLMVALYVIDKIKRGVTARLAIMPQIDAKAIELKAVSIVSSRIGLGALVVLLVGGAVTLGLEVVFMHLLAVVAGNSVYAFGLMLATFLAGLGLGSSAGERLMLHLDRAKLVICAQCGIAMAILATAYVWDGLASYMGSFSYAQRFGVHLDFGGRELIRALVCALAMMPPAFFIGVSYPAAMGLAADWLGRRTSVVRGVGAASGVNTLGNISGVLLCGFWWLPTFGSRNVLLGLAIAVLILAALMTWVDQQDGAGSSTEKIRGNVVRNWAPVSVMAIALIFFPSQWNYTALSQGGNVYFSPQQWGNIIDHAESVEGGMTTVAQKPDGLLTLLTNGKFQGNNAEAGEMVAQESFAMIPLLHTAQRENALVIGYGTGMTARVLQNQGFKYLDVVELSRDIVFMADKYFNNINAHISSHPSVQMHYTDGRNYLLTQTKRFDLISLEISSIWFAGAANLYNREFYELASKRLLPQGVMQQWVQLHHMRPIDFLYILGSVRSVFKNVWIYVSGGQGIIVASNDDAALDNHTAVRKLLNGHAISEINVEQLPSALVAGPARVDAVIRRFDPTMSFFTSTDKNLYLEYATPKGNAVNVNTSPILIDMLRGRQ